MAFLSSCLYFFYVFSSKSYDELEEAPLLMALLFSLLNFLMLAAAAKYFYSSKKHFNENRTTEKIILVLSSAFIGGGGMNGSYTSIDTGVFCFLYVVVCILFMETIYKSYEKLGVYSEGGLKGLNDSTFERREGLNQARVAGCFFVAIPFLSYLVWTPLK